MRISDIEVQKILTGSESLVQEIEEISLEGARHGRDRELIRQVATDIIAMPDRDEYVAEIKARLEAGAYNPTGDDIADAMIRRSIADKVR